MGVLGMSRLGGWSCKIGTGHRERIVGRLGGGMKGPGGTSLGMRLRDREGGRGLLGIGGSAEMWKRGMCGRFFLCPWPCDRV